MQKRTQNFSVSTHTPRLHPPALDPLGRISSLLACSLSLLPLPRLAQAPLLAFLPIPDFFCFLPPLTRLQLLPRPGPSPSSLLDRRPSIHEIPPHVLGFALAGMDPQEGRPAAPLRRDGLQARPLLLQQDQGRRLHRQCQENI